MQKITSHKEGARHVSSLVVSHADLTRKGTSPIVGLSVGMENVCMYAPYVFFTYV